ncbi:acyltransferase [Pontibacter sp. BT310]|uniref:Acyltransferase n=1 Tax=Pontibacter populi TaxID=890055 RepID=A0ABS6XDI5_9BACT|nr:MULTISPECIES: acyltransferase [Pontibacter]MBJ6119205.1 acyltransferase [Pontibacter sp. BT310]MBR0571633.1 acyltransferase [Microvirga sp. STS03]MBW3366059.1 acyltransferase [Pontibacter populi]
MTYVEIKERQTGRDKFNRNKRIIDLLVYVMKFLPKFLRIFIWDTVSPFSQIPFIGLRYVILKSLIKNCGSNIRIGKNVNFIYWEYIEIGDNVSIHPNCYIDGAGGVKIGNDVSIAHNTSILSADHNWSDYTLPIKYNSVTTKSVLISNDVWIACGCRILGGVKINTRSIIAAGAVVNKDVKSNAIFGGVPARLIKEI